MDVVEHRSACVGDVGRVHQASREHPHKPGVNGAKEQLARLGALAGTGHVVKDPADLGKAYSGAQCQEKRGICSDFATGPQG